MILKLYVVRDEVSQENRVILSAENDDVLKRNIKAVLCSPEPNYLVLNTKDKRVYWSGSLDTDTGVIIPKNPIESVCTVEAIRQELSSEINGEKSRIMLEAISKGFDESKAKAYLQLFENANFFGLKTSREEALEASNVRLNEKIARLEALLKERIGKINA